MKLLYKTKKYSGLQSKGYRMSHEIFMKEIIILGHFYGLCSYLRKGVQGK